MSDPTTRRRGLRPPFTRRTLDSIARAEVAVAHLLRGGVRFRRISDIGEVVRFVDPGTVRIHEYFGLTIGITSAYVDGVLDNGLRCSDCPLCDLVPLHAEVVS